MYESVILPATIENPRNSEADIIQLSDGRLLLGWSKFYGNEDHSPCEIWAKYSEDGGYTWSEGFTLQRNIGKCNVMSVSFIKLDKHKIGFFYAVKNTPNTDANFYLRISSDDGKTFSEPIRVSVRDGYNVMNNARVIKTKNGRILAPVAYYKNVEKDPGEGICYYSDDDGKTWKVSKSVHLKNSKTGIQEPGLVELENGDLLMIIRCDKGYIYKSYSYDGGISWSEPEPMPLVSPQAPASIARIKDSSILLIIWNPNPLGKYGKWEDRWPLCSAISEDNGNTWKNIKYLENNPMVSHGYTSITFIEDKTILSYYEWKRLSSKKIFEGTSLKIKIIETSWFYK